MPKIVFLSDTHGQFGRIEKMSSIEKERLTIITPIAGGNLKTRLFIHALSAAKSNKMLIE